MTAMAIVSQTMPVQALLAGQISPNTRRAYQQAVSHFADWIGGDLQHVTRDQVTAYRNQMLEAGYAAGTIAQRLTVISMLFEEARFAGLVQRNPCERVKRPKVSDESTTAGLTEREAAAMLATCDRTTVKGARDYALLKLALYTGLRRSEIVSAKWGDITQDRGHWILWVTGKGGKRAKVKLQVHVKRALDEYLQQSGRKIEPTSPLFVATQHGRGEVPLDDSSVAYIVKTAAKRAGIAKRITPHSLRHTAVTLALDGGATVRQVQAFARHSDPKTTMRYDRNRGDLDDNGTDYIRIREEPGQASMRLD
jgi:site-specific recombinase XerD